MPVLDSADQPLVPAMPAWLPEALLWLGVAGVLLAAVCAAGVWTLVARGRRLQAQARHLQGVDELRVLLERLVSARADLDVRRIEHVLIDLRDAQLRLEDAMLRAIEATRREPAVTVGGDVVPVTRQEDLGERVVNRLLALGYERVHVVTRSEKLREIVAKDGEVLVEARRQGVMHKGRVTVRSGRLADIDIHPAYSIFP